MLDEVKKTKSYYEKHAHEWAQNHSDSFYHEKDFRFFRSLIQQNASVVDIGCANGRHVPLFLGIGKGLKYHGIDITQKFVKMASERYPQLPFREGDIADRTTLPTKKFDAFLALAILMHLPLSLWDAAFKNIEHMTKAGAYGYIMLPVQRPSTTVSPLNDLRHFTLLSEKEQITYMKNRGWIIVKKFKHATQPNKTHWVGYVVQLPR